MSLNVPFVKRSPDRAAEPGPSGEPASQGSDDRSVALPADVVTGSTVQLPDGIRAKLQPPRVLLSTGPAAWWAPIAALVQTARAAVAARVPARSLSRLSALSAALRTSVAAMVAHRPDWTTRLGQLLPKVPEGVGERMLARGRSAALQIGAMLDKLVRPPVAAPDATAVPEPEGQPYVEADEHAHPDPAYTDGADAGLSTIAVRAAVRRPSVFAPGHLLTALLAGGIIHIVTTFSITAFNSGSAYRQLRPVLPANQMVVLPPLAPGAQILPYLAPDMLYAICRFDLSAGPVVVDAVLPEIGWSLALYTRHGDNFYAAPGQRQRPLPVTFSLQPATDRLLNVTLGSRKSAVEINEVVSPDTDGLLVIRAPLKGIAYEAAAMAQLKRARCTPKTR